ncbi:MAG: hypothetical protein ACJ74M_07575 [Gaiellaceae bacterium]
MQIPQLIGVNDEARAPSPATADGRVHTWHEHGQVCAYGYAAAGADWMQVPNIATFRLGREIQAFASPSTSKASINAAFERSVLPMAIQTLGGNALHASAVLAPAGVVAFCGESGSGKSTAAHALAVRGYPAWADDAVAFECVESGCTSTRLPFELSLRPDAAARAADERPVPRATPKAAPVARVVVLRRDPTTSVAVRALSAGEALQSLLEQAYCFRPDAASPPPALVDGYLTLTATVAVLEVRYAPDWHGFGLLIDTLEENLVSG